MSKTADYIGQAAADSTNALNPLLGGLNRQELLGSVAMMLRRTSISPMANAKFAGKMAKEGYDIALGKSERTVKNQVSAILAKYGVPTRARLIALLR